MRLSLIFLTFILGCYIDIPLLWLWRAGEGKEKERKKNEWMNVTITLAELSDDVDRVMTNELPTTLTANQRWKDVKFMIRLSPSSEFKKNSLSLHAERAVWHSKCGIWGRPKSSYFGKVNWVNLNVSWKVSNFLDDPIMIVSHFCPSKSTSSRVSTSTLHFKMF